MREYPPRVLSVEYENHVADNKQSKHDNRSNRIGEINREKQPYPTNTNASAIVKTALWASAQGTVSNTI